MIYTLFTFYSAIFTYYPQQDQQALFYYFNLELVLLSRSSTSTRDSTERYVTMVKDMGLCGKWDCLNQWRMFCTPVYKCEHFIPCKQHLIYICRGISVPIQTKFYGDVCKLYRHVCQESSNVVK